MKILSLFIGLFLLSGFVNAQDMYKVTADKLNVRQSNDTKSKIIGFVPNGENVAVLDSSDAKYFKIKVTNGEGWVSKEFLTKIPSTKPVQQKTEVKVAIPSAQNKDYTSIVMLFIAGIVLVAGIILALKYSKNYVTIGLCVAVVVVISYFTYDNFFRHRNIAGHYINTKVRAQYESFDFKPKDSVLVKDFYADSTFTAHYTTEGNMIRFNDNQNVIILLIQNDDTLIGEGFTDGTFKRN